MGHLILKGDDTFYPGFSLLGEPSLAITMDETLIGDFNIFDFLVLSGTPSVSITSIGATLGDNTIHQIDDLNNALTTVTIHGSDFFTFGGGTGNLNSGDGVVTDITAAPASATTIHSSLSLIDASATTGGVIIFAGAINTIGFGHFFDGGSLNGNVTITYNGLTIKGGSGHDVIENDAKNGVVIDGNGNDVNVTLGGPGAKAILGTGIGDIAAVGISNLGTFEAAGSAVGDKVTFGHASKAELIVGGGAEAGATAGTTSIGLTKVVNAAVDMQINFADEVGVVLPINENAAVAAAPNLTAAENAAVSAMNSPGIAYFNFRGNEYFIATNHAEAAVSAHDAIVELVGVVNLNSSTIGPVITLHL